MTWPRVGESAGEIQHVLRYGKPTREQLLLAAGIISAYQTLAYKSQRDRNYICKQLKEAEDV
jgi:hypothetical protein